MSFVSPFSPFSHASGKRAVKSSSANMIIIQFLRSNGTMPILNNVKFYRILTKVDGSNKNRYNIRIL